MCFDLPVEPTGYNDRIKGTLWEALLYDHFFLYSKAFYAEDAGRISDSVLRSIEFIQFVELNCTLENLYNLNLADNDISPYLF